MKWTGRALPIIAACFHDVRAAVSNNIIQDNEDVITPLGPNDPVVLDISCTHLFENSVSTIKGAMLHISIKDRENYFELTQDPACKPKFMSKCRALSAEHLKDLMEEEWEWKDAPSPKERFTTLMSEGCANDIDAWDAVTMEKVPIIEDVVQVSSLIHWTNFQPSVLAHLIEKRNSKASLPSPLAENSFYIRRLLESQISDASKSDMWTIFDHTFCSLAANKTANVGETLAKTYEKIAQQVSRQAHLALVAVRVQTMLLEYVKSNDRPPLEEITKITENHLANIIHTLKGKGNAFVKSLVTKVAPEVSSALSQMSPADLRAKLDSLFNNLFQEDDKNRDLELFDEPSLHQFAEMIGEYSMEERDQWISEYISVFAFVKADFDRNYDLISRFMQTAIAEIKTFFGPLKSSDNIGSSLIPYRAFKLVNTMLKIGIPQAPSFVSLLNEAIGAPEEKENPRKALLKGLKGHLLGPISMALIESCDDLRLIASRRFVPPNHNSVPINIPRDDGGFNLKSAYEFIVDNPLGFLNPQSFLKGPEFIDAGGVMRGFIEQLLYFIDQYLVENASTSVGGHLKRIKLMSQRDSGTFIGAVYAKAFEYNQRPVAALDANFYRLLGKAHDDNAVEEYFDMAYSDLLLDYKMTFMGQRFSEEEFSSKMRSVIPIPLNEVKMLGPFDKTREWMPDFAEVDQPCQYTRETIITTYYVQFRQLLLDEFKAYVKNFSKLFSKVFDVENLEFCTNSQAIESLFQTYNLLPQHLIDATKFRSEDLMIASFFVGHDISIKDAFLSFIHQLNSRQLSKLLSVWTGSSTLELAGNSITAEFRTPVAGNLQRYNPEDIFEYCRSNESGEGSNGAQDKDVMGMTETVIDRPFEFCNILKRTIAYQKDLILKNAKDVSEESLKLVSHQSVDAYTAKIGTCSKSIFIYQQDSICLFQTLVLLVNTPSSEYFDNTGHSAQQQAPQLEAEEGQMGNADQIGDDDYVPDNDEGL